MSIVNTRPATLIGPEGNPDSPIMFVGEAPSSIEMKLRRPFSGPPGDLLMECMRVVGIPRSECYMTTLIKEQPYRNDMGDFVSLKKKLPYVSVKAQVYIEKLKREIEQSNCNVIVAFGTIALWALTEERSITKWRGSVLDCTLVPGKKVIGCIHPGSAMRNYLYRHYITHDMKRIQEESKFPDIREPARNYIIAPSMADTMIYLERCLESDMVAFDIEVSNMEMSCISFAVDSTSVISIPFIEGGREYFNITQEMEVMRKITEVLENPNIIKLGQNVIFDTTFLFRKYGIRTRPCHDTMIGQAILLPEFPKGLDFITSIYTKERYYKDEGKHRIKTGRGSDRTFWLYNAKDSIVLMEAFPSIYKELEKQENLDTYTRQAGLIEPLVFCSEHGIKMDTNGLKDERVKVQEQIDVLYKELCELCGFEINFNSPKQLKDYFYITKGLKPYKDRKTHRISTNEEALKRIARKGHKEASILLKLRGLNKLKSTYLDVTLDDDKRLRCSYNPVGTRSGRLSSGKTIFGTGTNLQNQPPIMKKYMIADDGYVIYNVDLSQAENRIVAYLGPDETMISAFESGRDIHSQTAGLVFNKPIDQISRKAGSCSIGSGEYSERFWGKKANHGLNYDLSYKSFALIYEIPEKESKFIVERYHTAYPGVRKFQAAIRNQLEQNRTLTNCFGRNRVFMDRWADPMFKEAYSFLPQSTVADMINEWGMIYIYNNTKVFGKVEILNQVHDSIVFQIPIDAGWEYHYNALMYLKDSLQKPIKYNGLKFSIPMDCEMGLNMKDTITTELIMSNELEEIYGRLKDGSKT